jgi:hypothetical protein
MNQSKVSLDELKALKDELELKLCEKENTRGHRYGLWSKDLNDDGTITYKRSCKKCGKESIITTSTLDLSIEKEISIQKDCEKYTNYFCNSSIDDLSDENILFFMAATEEKQAYMDMNKIVNKIVDIGKTYEVHNDNSQKLINDAVLHLHQSGYIPNDSFKAIWEHLIQMKLIENKDITTIKSRAA